MGWATSFHRWFGGFPVRVHGFDIDESFVFAEAQAEQFILSLKRALLAAWLLPYVPRWVCAPEWRSKCAPEQSGGLQSFRQHFRAGALQSIQGLSHIDRGTGSHVPRACCYA
jgi:hypothetical protein